MQGLGEDLMRAGSCKKPGTFVPGLIVCAGQAELGVGLVLTGSCPDYPSVDDCQAAAGRSDALAVVSVALVVALAAAEWAVAALAAAVVAFVVAVPVVAAADAPAARCGTYWLRSGRRADVVPEEEPVALTGAAVWERPDEPEALVPEIVPVHSGAEHFVAPAAGARASAVPDDWAALAAPAGFAPVGEQDYSGVERSPARLGGQLRSDVPVLVEMAHSAAPAHWDEAHSPVHLPARARCRAQVHSAARVRCRAQVHSAAWARLPGRVRWDAPVRSDVQVHFRAQYWLVPRADPLCPGASVLPER